MLAAPNQFIRSLLLGLNLLCFCLFFWARHRLVLSKLLVGVVWSLDRVACWCLFFIVSCLSLFSFLGRLFLGALAFPRRPERADNLLLSLLPLLLVLLVNLIQLAVRHKWSCNFGGRTGVDVAFLLSFLFDCVLIRLFLGFNFAQVEQSDPAQFPWTCVLHNRRLLHVFDRGLLVIAELLEGLLTDLGRLFGRGPFLGRNTRRVIVC